VKYSPVHKYIMTHDHVLWHDMKMIILCFSGWTSDTWSISQICLYD